MPQEKKLKQTTLMQRKDDPPSSIQRKRATQLRQTSDDEQTKRIKKLKPPPKPKTKRRLKKAVSDNFDFKTEETHTLSPETPKLVRAPVSGLEDEMEISDVSELEATSASSDSSSLSSEGITSAVSVSIRKNVPNVQKRAPKGSRKDAGKMSDALADLYVRFDPLSEAYWKKDQRVPYKRLADTFQSIEQTTKRLEITRLITECFRCILATVPQDLKPAVYLCVNRVGPAHEGLELGIGDSILVKAIAGASGGADIAKIKKQYDTDGDLGSVAMNRKGGQNLLAGFRPLSIVDVFNSFVEIAKDSGEKTQERKRAAIERLLNASKGNETKFITRSLQVSHLHNYLKDTENLYDEYHDDCC